MKKILPVVFVAVLLTFPMGKAEAADFKRLRPINEGNDTQPCVTYREASIVGLNIRRERVRKVVDTDGHKVDNNTLAGLGPTFEALGIDPNDIDAAPRKYQEVRLYPMCEGEGSFYLVVYDTRSYRTVLTYFQ